MTANVTVTTGVPSLTARMRLPRHHVAARDAAIADALELVKRLEGLAELAPPAPMGSNVSDDDIAEVSVVDVDTSRVTTCTCEDATTVNHDEVVAWLNTTDAGELLEFIEWATLWGDIDDDDSGFLSTYDVERGDSTPLGDYPVRPCDLEDFAKLHQLVDSARTFKVLNHIDWANNTFSALRKRRRADWEARKATPAPAPKVEPLRKLRPEPENRRKGGILGRLDTLEAAVVDMVNHDCGTPDGGEVDRLHDFLTAMGPGRPDDPTCDDCGRPLKRDDAGEWGECVDCPGDGE